MPNSKLRFAALAIFLAGCGATTVTNNPAVVLKSVLVSPKSVTLLAGGTSQLSALGIYSDGSTQDLTSTATWTSSGPAVTVSASGLATAVNAGTATITATQGGFSSASSITVTAAGVIGLSIFAPTLRLPAGHSEVLSAIAISSDGSTTSTSPTWSITQGSDKGQISASGQLTGTAAGIVRVQAQQGSLTSTRDITIDDATASALTVTPSTLTLAAGQSRTLSAFATFSDGASLDVSADAAFSSDSGLIELDGAQVLAISAGTAAITVSYEGKSATSTLTITAVPPARVVVGGPSAMFTTHAAQFTASAIYPGGDALDVTNDATWTVTPSGTAATGTVSVSTAGTSTVSATFQGLIGLATVQVRAPAPQSLSIASVGQALSVGRSALLAATLTLTDSSVQDVTGTVTWTSDNADITVAAGVVTAHQSGSATITATLASASLSATFDIDAADAQLIDLVIAPKSLEIPAGARATFQAYGVYDDGHAALLDPSEGTWFVDDENVDSLGGGVFQGNSSGGTTVHYERDDLSAEARLNVIEVTTQAVVIVGNATLQLGTQATFSAFQSLSNGTVGPCSNPFWSVNAGPATVDRFGTVTATGVGDTTLTVDCGEASGHLDLHVLDRAKVGFLLSPQLRSVPVGGQFAFQTFDLYSDGTLVNVTAQTTFATTSTNALTAGGAFTATTQGTAFVHATRGTDVALGTIQVGPPAVVALVAQPAPPLLAVGGTLQLAAYALYSDGALVDRTAHATFATTDATFSVTPQGLVTGLQSGSAAVTLTDLDSGFTGTAMVYVVPAGYPLITGPVVFSNVTSDSAHVHIPVSGQITDGVASFITGNDELARYYYNLPTDKAPDGLDFDIPYTCLGGPGMALNFSLGGPSGTTYYYSSNQPFGQVTIQTSGYFGPAGLPVAILDAPASTCTFPDLTAPQFQETTVEQGGLAHLIVHVTDNTVTEGVDLRRPGSSNSYGGAVDAAFLDDGLVSLTVATSCIAPATSIYAQLYAQDSAGLHTRYALPAGPLTAYDVRHGNSVNGEKAAGQSTFAPASIKVVPGACNFGGFTTAPHWSVNQATIGTHVTLAFGMTPGVKELAIYLEGDSREYVVYYSNTWDPNVTEASLDFDTTGVAPGTYGLNIGLKTNTHGQNYNSWFADYPNFSDTNFTTFQQDERGTGSDYVVSSIPIPMLNLTAAP